MTNINLSQSIQPKKFSTKSGKTLDKGTLIPVVVLFLAFLAWGGVEMYRLDFEKKITDVEMQISTESGKIRAEDVNRIADFQNRLEKVAGNISAKKNPNDILDKIANVLMGKAYLESFEYDSAKGTVNLRIVSGGIEEVAQQTLSLKESPYFTKGGVNTFGEYVEDEKGKVRYGAELVLSNDDSIPK